jgi:hypothetical protein
MPKKLYWLFVIVVFLVFIGCEKDVLMQPEFRTAEEQPSSVDSEAFYRFGHGSRAVKVMDWNIYIGTNVDTVLTASDPSEVPDIVAWAFELLLSTNFPERAQAIANQILIHRPALIGLQEVTLLRSQSPGDAIVGGIVPAEDVLINYLDVLLFALKLRGLNYKVAGMIQNADVEVPVPTDDPAVYDDIRVTDSDVILVRHDVEISRVTAENYQVFLTVSLPPFNIDILRGYVAVDAKIGARTYRFVNTHLEPFVVDPIQIAQAQELLQTLDNETLPVIMVGDFNSRAPSGITYQMVTSRDYVDVWTQNRLIPFLRKNKEGYTSPHDADLRNQEIKLDQRIDFIFVRNNLPNLGWSNIGPVYANVVGDQQIDRTIPSWLWPSDHAGVVARLKIPTLPSFVTMNPETETY